MTQLRRDNLEALIDARFAGSKGKFADAVGRSRSYIYRIFAQTVHGGKNLGADLAREIEALLGLPNFWLDIPHPAGFDPFEQELLDIYRHSNDQGKLMLRVTANAVRDNFSNTSNQRGNH